MRLIITDHDDKYNDNDNKDNDMVMIMMIMIMILMIAGLKSNVAYNDHELPSQLSPDQYFKLEWALSEDRQELAHEEGDMDS